MTVDSTIIPGLLFLLFELMTLAAVGFVVARTLLRHDDGLMALAQGLILGLALWALIANFVMLLVPGVPGAAIAWATTLAGTIGLAWRTPRALQISVHLAVKFAIGAVVLFWTALASRQLLPIVDAYLHLSLASSIRAGIFPPEFSWHPGEPAPYHYGSNLVTAMLAPPFGPDLALTTEVVDAYIWTSLAIVLITVALRYGSPISALATCPLILSFGLWTQLHYTSPPGILQVLVPTSLPEGGLRTSLMSIYWPSLEYSWIHEVEASPPNISKPNFMLAYATSLVALERITGHRRRGLIANTTLAFLVGYVGLVEESVALVVLALWAITEVYRLRTLVRLKSNIALSNNGDASSLWRWHTILSSALGPLLAALLLLGAIGATAGALSGSTGSGLSLSWIDDAGSRRPLAHFVSWSGGVGLLELGTVATIALALSLSCRNRLVQALTIASAVFLLSALTVHYKYAPHDIARLDGHARNFALFALLVAIGVRSNALPQRWRIASAILIVSLVAWPTAIAPARNIGFSLRHGPSLANADPRPSARVPAVLHRSAIQNSLSQVIVDHIRKRTAVDARILSPKPTEMSIATARPNSSGFLTFIQFKDIPGPEYLDALRFLEPHAVKQLGFTYVHTTQDWIASLPNQALRWLSNPEYFELLAHHGSDSLYRIKPAFLELSVIPTPGSFEALRRSVPTSATVYMSPALDSIDAVRVAVALSHSSLIGTVRPTWHSQADIVTRPLHRGTPDFVVAPLNRASSSFPEDARRPTWWFENTAIYALGGGSSPLLDLPEETFSVEISKVRMDTNRVVFKATFINAMADHWTGQDWLVVAADASPWAIPVDVRSDGITHDGKTWFAGQIDPTLESLTRVFEYNARAGTLAVQSDSGTFDSVQSSGQRLDPGIYTLAVRLNAAWREVGLIPVLKIVVTSTNDVTYEVYEGLLGARLRT